MYPMLPRSRKLTERIFLHDRLLLGVFRVPVDKGLNMLHHIMPKTGILRCQGDEDWSAKLDYLGRAQTRSHVPAVRGQAAMLVFHQRPGRSRRFSISASRQSCQHQIYRRFHLRSLHCESQWPTGKDAVDSALTHAFRCSTGPLVSDNQATAYLMSDSPAAPGPLFQLVFVRRVDRANLCVLSLKTGLAAAAVRCPDMAV